MNYYMIDSMTDKFRYHIGKSSFGWTFSLHIKPPFINGIKEIERFLSLQSVHVEDQNKNILTKDEMLSIIYNRIGEDKWWNEITQEWLDQRDAIKDPRNLVRFKVGDIDVHVKCIGYEDGPWDLIVGDFC